MENENRNGLEVIKISTNDIIISEMQDDPTIIKAKIILCDFLINGNNVRIIRENADKWIGSLVSKPLVGKVVKVRAKDGSGLIDDFSGHNMRKIKIRNQDGTITEDVVFDTSAFGSFVSCDIETIDGQDYIVGNVHVWKRFRKAAEVFLRRVAEGTLKLSWELDVLESYTTVENGKIIKNITNACFEGDCALGESVQPAYDCSRVTEVAEKENSEIELVDAIAEDAISISNSNKEVVGMTLEDKEISAQETSVCDPKKKECKAECNPDKKKTEAECNPDKKKEDSECNPDKKKEDSECNPDKKKEQSECGPEKKKCKAESKKKCKSESPDEEDDDMDDDEDEMDDDMEDDKEDSAKCGGGKKKKCASTELEASALTVRDLHVKLYKAIAKVLNEDCFDIAYLFPVDKTVWVKKYGRDVSELDYVAFTYDVGADDEVILSEPQDVTLTVSVAQVNDKISQLNEAVASANATINDKDNIIAQKDKEIAELTVYKDKFDAAEKERIEVETAQKRNELSQYALDSGLISCEEIASASEGKDAGSLYNLIENLDKAGINTVIAERYMDKNKNKTQKHEVASKKETPSVNSVKTVVSSAVDEEALDPMKLVRDFYTGKR